MRLADLVREITYPLREISVVIAMLFFVLIFGLADWGGAFGIPLLLITIPAYIRYLIYLLEAHANGRPPPVPDLAMFNPFDNLWSLTPAILLAVFMFAAILLAVPGSAWIAYLIYAALLLIAPASLAILAITHSPSESLNPAAIIKMIRVCGAAYFLVPAITLALYFLIGLLEWTGLPSLLVDLSQSYQVILFFTLTGALLYANDVIKEVDIGPPLARSDDEVAGDLAKERQKVANHAYGFISRNNRAGGFAHINQWLDKEADIDAASEWFFREMQSWENSAAALFFAQQYLNRLLHEEQEVAALKLVARCLHEDPRWKPQLEDRALFLELAERHGRGDLAGPLG
jgi:hypothetical protein